MEIVDNLSVGLTQVRDLFMARIHDDVEKQFGMDSMIAPLSVLDAAKQVHRAKCEVEAYCAILVDDEVGRGGYLNGDGQWFGDWIFNLRLGHDYRSFYEDRVKFYRSKTVERRRLKFMRVLQRAAPESVKAPLVLFRLFPRAVRIVTAVAFGDPLRAQEVRSEQCQFLPLVSECHECHGSILPNEDVCRCCSNPLWKYAWLCSD